MQVGAVGLAVGVVGAGGGECGGQWSCCSLSK